VNALEVMGRDGPVSSEVRKLQSRLWRRAAKEGRKIILLTSPLQGEGKSTTLALVAVAAARDRNRRVLAVDLDFRRPTLNTFFDAEPDAGLVRYLAGDGPLEGTTRPTPVANLDAAYAVPSDSPDELVASALLGPAFAQWRERYDLILVDAPALGPVADAAAVIPHTDGVLLLVMAGRSSKHHLARTRELLLGMDAVILGLVVGNIQEAAPQYLDGGYYAYYRRSEAPRETGSREL
jgi:non-specific protein-tyrosine kinase